MYYLLFGVLRECGVVAALPLHAFVPPLLLN